MTELLKRKPFWIIFFLCLVIYGQTLSYSFLAWDDDVNIFNNSLVNHWLTSDFKNSLSRIWSAPYYGLYAPMAYSIWSLIGDLSFLVKLPSQTTPHPALFHLANVSLHWVNSVLVYSLFWNLPPTLLKKNKDNSYAALLAALVFCCHPLQVEAVAWVSGFRDLLSTSLGLLSGWMLFSSEKRPKPSSFILAWLLFTLGLLAKPSLVALPIAWLLLDYLSKGEGVSKPLRSWGLLIRWVPWFLSSAWVTYFTVQAQAYAQSPTVSWFNRPILVMDSLSFYLSKVFIPMHLSSDYGRSTEQVLSSIPAQGIAISILFLALLVWFWKKGYRLSLLGFSIFAITLTPVLGWYPFHYQTYSTVADHYTYLPMLGISLTLGSLWNTKRNLITTAAGTGFLIVLACLALCRTPVWKDNLSFFQDMVVKNPESIHGNLSLGNLAAASSHPEEALRYFEKVIQVAPLHPAALSNQVNMLLKLGRFQEALDRVLKLLPDEESIKRMPESSTYFSAWYEMAGHAKWKLGDLPGARVMLCKSVQVNPGNESALGLLKNLKEDWKQRFQSELPVCE